MQNPHQTRPRTRALKLRGVSRILPSGIYAPLPSSLSQTPEFRRTPQTNQSALKVYSLEYFPHKFLLHQMSHAFPVLPSQTWDPQWLNRIVQMEISNPINGWQWPPRRQPKPVKAKVNPSVAVEKIPSVNVLDAVLDGLGI